MTSPLYPGVNAAVLTAMGPDLSVNLDRTAAHCRWLLANGCDGLAILGTTGEANSLGLDERVALMEGLVERGIPAARMLPGTGTPALPDTVLLTRRAAELGCPGVLVLPPFYYKDPSEDGLFAWFSEVVQRTGGAAGLYLYHFPAQSAVPITLGLVARLLRAHPGAIRGVKDSSGDFDGTRAYVEQFGAEGFEVHCGSDAQLLRALRAGAAGCITAGTNVTCATAAQVVAGWREGAGERPQEVLAALRRAIGAAPLIPGLKELVARNTGDAAWRTIRPPHLPLDDAAAARLFAAYDACGVALAPAE